MNVTFRDLIPNGKWEQIMVEAHSNKHLDDDTITSKFKIFNFNDYDLRARALDVTLELARIRPVSYQQISADRSRGLLQPLQTYSYR